MSFSYQQVYGFTPKKYKKHNFYALVSRSLKIGGLEKEIKNGHVYLKLTSLGKEKILNKIPFFKLRKKRWDGKWLMVVFDIPEKHSSTRRALREKLRELGFGMLQRSVWISPYNFSSLFQEFLENIGLSEKVLVVGPTKIGVKDEKALASKVFKLKKVDKEYKKLFEKWENKGEKGRRDLIREIKTDYLEILASDPLLPESLLPKDWLGKRAAELIKRLVKIGVER